MRSHPTKTGHKTSPSLVIFLSFHPFDKNKGKPHKEIKSTRKNKTSKQKKTNVDPPFHFKKLSSTKLNSRKENKSNGWTLFFKNFDDISCANTIFACSRRNLRAHNECSLQKITDTNISTNTIIKSTEPKIYDLDTSTITSSGFLPRDSIWVRKATFKQHKHETKESNLKWTKREKGIKKRIDISFSKQRNFNKRRVLW